MRTYKDEIAELVAPHAGIPVQEIRDAITLPQHAGHGDFAFPCFPLAKKLRKAPPAIAQEMAERIAPVMPIVKIEALNGYLNFFIDPADFSRRTLSAIARQGAAYGSSDRGRGQTVVIDFSSPNMGKELAFHHLRGTMIGHSLSRLYARAGYRVVRINHLGDWGTSYGKLIVMFLREGLRESDLAGMTIERLNGLYTAFAEAAKADPTLEDQAREAFQRLESGDAGYRGLWEAFKEITLRELKRIYGFLAVEFDSYIGEAFFLDHMPETLEMLAGKNSAGKNLVVRSQGADIVDLTQHNLPPVLLRKTDGATLYITRDIAAAIYRKKTYDFDKCLYVVDNGQSLHFQQLFKVLELMGFDWSARMEHVPFGLVLIKSEDGGWEKGKTRSGQASLLKDVLEGAQEKILGIIREKNPEAAHKEGLAMQIGVGALVFSEMKNRRLNDIRFEWDKALSFEGDSGPYVQNAHVRLCSILRKSAERNGRSDPDRPARNGEAGIDFAKFPEPQAQTLIRTLSLMPDKINAAVDSNDPCPMAQYALEIAEGAHGFIHSCRVLGSSEEKERLYLIDCARIALGQTLELIGVPAIEEM